MSTWEYYYEPKENLLEVGAKSDLKVEGNLNKTSKYIMKSDIP